MENKSGKERIGEAVDMLINEGKKSANDLYEKGLDKIHDVEANLQEYSETILKKIKEKPVTSVLIAAGIGFVLSKLIQK